MRRYRFALFAAVTLLPAVAVSGQVGASGQVMDQSGRPLPFVVVTSRTANGFLSVYTDLTGQFDFDDRPHRRGNTIEFRSFGFHPTNVRLEGDSDRLVVRLDSSSAELSGWNVGLVSEIGIELLNANGTPNDPMQLKSRTPYRIVVSYRGLDRCSKPGPSMLEKYGNDVVVAIAMFRRGRSCGSEMVDYSHAFDFEFEHASRGSIRVVGLYEDLVIPFVVSG